MRIASSILASALLVLLLGAAGADAASPSPAPHPARSHGHKRGMKKPRVQMALHGHRRLISRSNRTIAQTSQEDTATATPTVSDSQPLPPGSGSILFRGNFDSGFGGWYVQSLPGRATVSPTSPFQGSADARFEVRPGDVEPDTGSNRSEVSGPTFNEGQDLYIRDAIRVPNADTYQGSWQIIQQLHETEWGSSPGLALFLGADRSLRLGPGSSATTFWQGPKLATERWYDLVYHVKLSQNASVGFVEVWLDGVQQTLTNGLTKAFGRTMQTPHSYLKAGIYRAPTSTGISVVEHDNIVVGTSLAAVMGS